MISSHCILHLAHATKTWLLSTVLNCKPNYAQWTISLPQFVLYLPLLAAACFVLSYQGPHHLQEFWFGILITKLQMFSSLIRQDTQGGIWMDKIKTGQLPGLSWLVLQKQRHSNSNTLFFGQILSMVNCGTKFILKSFYFDSFITNLVHTLFWFFFAWEWYFLLKRQPKN